MKWALLLMGMSCATIPVKTPTLGRGGEVGMQVLFLGTVPEADTMYICKLDKITELSCVDYVYFMRELEKQK